MRERRIYLDEWSVRQYFKREIEAQENKDVFVLPEPMEVADIKPIYAFVDDFVKRRIIQKHLTRELDKRFKNMASARAWLPEQELKDFLKSESFEIMRVMDERASHVIDPLRIQYTLSLLDDIIQNALQQRYFYTPDNVKTRRSITLNASSDKAYSLRNQTINTRTRDDNAQKVYEFLCDYDLNDSKPTYQVVADGVGLSEKTIGRIVKESPEVKEVYDAIKSQHPTVREIRMTKKDN